MTSLSSGEPGGNYVLKPGRANRLDPIALAELVFLMLSLRRLWCMGNHPCGDKYGDELDVPCEVRCNASDLSIYNSCV